DGVPALEITLSGGEFLFDAPVIAVLAGSDFGAGVPLWTPFEIPAGGTLRCAGTRSGARCYLAVRGGLDVPRVMGSAAVHVMTGVGGRPLRKGDTLAIGDAAVRKPRPPARHAPVYPGSAVLRVTPGPQAARF